MIQAEAVEQITNLYGVREELLKTVHCEAQPVAVKEWASNFFKVKQCYSNALNMSLVDECDYILGFVFLKDAGVVIEHAWNCDGEGHLDLTAELFWKLDTPTEYIEVVRLSTNSAEQQFEQYGGVDFLSMRKSKEYSHIFMRRQ